MGDHIFECEIIDDSELEPGAVDFAIFIDFDREKDMSVRDDINKCRPENSA